MPPTAPYPNAPLALVACEIRYSTLHPAISRSVWKQLHSRVSEWTPVVKSVARPVVNDSGEQVEQETAPRFLNRTRTLSVTFGAMGLLVETTSYRGWTAAFRPLLKASIEALAESVEPTGVERMGLRYIDEIRLPVGGRSPEDWTSYIAEAIHAPSLSPELSDLHPQTWQGLVAYRGRDNRQVVVRYGLREGVAVNQTGVLRRPSDVVSGPFFLIDTDSFWEPVDEIPAYSVGQLLDMADELHAPVTQIFESLITDRLREEVLNAH